MSARHPMTRPMSEERVSDIDLDALIMTWERNPHLLGFRDAVLSCLRELKATRSLSASERGMREAIREFVAWADRNDWGTVPKSIEAGLRAALTGKKEDGEQARSAALRSASITNGN